MPLSRHGKVALPVTKGGSPNSVEKKPLQLSCGKLLSVISSLVLVY